MSKALAKRGRKRTRTQIPAVRALDRGLTVLKVLSRNGAMALSDIAKASELTCSTTFRLLETLGQRGFALQDEETGRYRLGASAIQIGAAYLANSPLPSLADAAMQQLVRVTNETVNLAIRDSDQTVYIHQVEAQQSVRMFTQLGARAPLYCTGVGKVLLAWKPVESVTQLFADVTFNAYTPNTIPGLDEMQAELACVRKQGYALDDEERELGVRCVAAPVRDARGLVIAAIGLSAPASRFLKKQFSKRSQEVIAAANEVSAQLGHQPVNG